MDSLNELRAIVQTTRGAKSLRATAREIGVSNVTLMEFLDGTNNTLSVESCLRFAHWLHVNPQTVLRLCGHRDIADLFNTEANAITDIYTQRISREMDGLTPEQKAAVVQNVSTFARALRETNGQYILGVNKTKKRKP